MQVRHGDGEDGLRDAVIVQVIHCHEIRDITGGNLKSVDEEVRLVDVGHGVERRSARRIAQDADLDRRRGDAARARSLPGS